MSKYAFVVVAGMVLMSLSRMTLAAELMPPGIGIRLTLAGPTFVDAQGMTLYQRRRDGEAGVGPCPDHPETVRPLARVGYNQVEEFPMQVPDAATRRSCVQKYPPLLAPADAAPVGHWTIYVRPSGDRQWAYRGKPLHRAIKDRAPGDIHGWMPGDSTIERRAAGWQIATAPLAAPSGIATHLTSLGLALTNHEGKTLYYAMADGRTAHSEIWKPFLAPAVAKTHDLPADWSITDYGGGLRQWAWKGKPLYTYAQDDGDAMPPDDPTSRFVDVFGDRHGAPIAGWQVALLVPASAPPAGVRVRSTYLYFERTDKIYADAEGKTLYAIYCAEMTEDRLDCDDVGDSALYWLSFCGGEKRCRRDWKRFVAPKDALSIDGLWSVAVINPSHPFKTLGDGEKGIPVWTYLGRPVFTFAEDEMPGDINGEFDFWSTVMNAVSIDAFAVPERK